MEQIFLRSGADKRLKRGHTWIYSNEVDTKKSPLTAFTAGQQVTVLQAGGKALGSAYINPQTLICGRIYSRKAHQSLDKDMLSQRVSTALKNRKSAFDKDFYRLIYGDSDSLPGLIVDRYGDYLVVQVSTSGMELVVETICDVLVELIKPKAILLKNDGKHRVTEGLNEQVLEIYGSTPDFIQIEENGVQFEIPVKQGQKTGWFYDHRLNRKRLQAYSSGKRVLDVFSYVGGWGVQAAAAGAKSVDFIDASQLALDQVSKNLRLNQIDSECELLCGDAFQQLKLLREAGKKYDVLILDPPAFITKRKDTRNGEQAYRRINQLGLSLLEEGGLLVSGSCSMHLETERLVDLVRLGGQTIGKSLQLLEQGGQGADHPVHLSIPETAYLKACFFRVLPNI